MTEAEFRTDVWAKIEEFWPALCGPNQFKQWTKALAFFPAKPTVEAVERLYRSVGRKTPTIDSVVEVLKSSGHNPFREYRGDRPDLHALAELYRRHRPEECGGKSDLQIAEAADDFEAKARWRYIREAFEAGQIPPDDPRLLVYQQVPEQLRNVLTGQLVPWPKPTWRNRKEGIRQLRRMLRTRPKMHTTQPATPIGKDLQ